MLSGVVDCVRTKVSVPCVLAAADPVTSGVSAPEKVPLVFAISVPVTAVDDIGHDPPSSSTVPAYGCPAESARNNLMMAPFGNTDVRARSPCESIDPLKFTTGSKQGVPCERTAGRKIPVTWLPEL